MTISIYQNPFVFEKHGPYFSKYIALCIRNFRNTKSKNTERHHIFPTCMCSKDEITGRKKPINESWNLVHLEYEDHQLAHELIASSGIYSGLKYADNIMNRKSFAGENNPNYGRTGEKHPMYGKKHTAEALAKMSGENSPMYRQGHKISGDRNGRYGKPGSKSMLGRTGESNPMYGRTGELCPAYGRKGELHPMYGKTGELHPTYGMKYELVVCPHCGKTGGGGAMNRWHFDNCKLKNKNGIE